MDLTRTKLTDGVPAWSWRDPNGRRWFLYRSFNMWRYRREDHDVSSIGYLTLEDAKKALAAAFEEARS